VIKAAAHLRASATDLQQLFRCPWVPINLQTLMHVPKNPLRFKIGGMNDRNAETSGQVVSGGCWPVSDGQV
jgi:hypothetical protein